MRFGGVPGGAEGAVPMQRLPYIVMSSYRTSTKEVTPDTRLLKTREISEILGVSPATAFRYIQTGLIPSVKIEGIRRINLDDLQDFIKLRAELEKSPEEQEALAADRRRMEKGPILKGAEWLAEIDGESS
jgi:predicted DNA-binding transcriptional regulator AlpA